MSWTYAGDLSSTREWVRFLIGDTDTDRQLLTDEEIAGVIAEEPNRYLAASTCARSLSSRFVRQGDGSLASEFRTLARQLQQRGRQFAFVPYAGGISESDIESVSADTDRPTPHFTVGMMDNSGSSSFEE
jgi:hypothetical protein